MSPRLAGSRRVAALLALTAVAGCGSAGVDNGALLANEHAHVPAEVTVQGTVTALLPDSDGPDGPHQNFDILVSGLTVQVINNLDLAPRVPVTRGVTVVVHGQFEPDPSGPIIHYTHHATGSHEGGYIELDGRTYQ